MSRARVFLSMSFVLVAVLAAACTGALSLGRASAAEDELQRADRFFKEQSFGKALEHYRAALADAEFADRRPRIRLAIGACFRGLDRWQEALDHYRALIADPDRLLATRANVRLGEVLFSRPHYYYEKNGKNLGHRHLPGAQYHSTDEEDYRGAEAAFERARAGFDAVVAERERPAAERERIGRERRALNVMSVQLFEVLQQRIAGWNRRENDERKERLKKVLALHERAIKALEENYLAAVLADDGPGAARALYGRGMYLRRYAERWWAKVDPTKPTETADSWFERLMREFPKDNLADDACYARAMVAQQNGDMLATIAHFEALEREWPSSRWVGDARAHTRRIRRPELTLDVGKIRLPGAEPTIKLRTRNIRALSFKAYRVPLEKYLGNVKTLAKLGNAALSNLATSLESIAGRDALRTNVEAEWRRETPDKGAHQTHQFSVKVPLTSNGAYLIEAASDRCRSAAVLIVSDLAIVRRSASERSLFFVADARSGEARGGIRIAARQKANNRRAFVELGASDDDGVWSVPTRFGLGTRYGYVEGFAWDDGRYAFTGWSYQSKRTDRTSGRTYAFTDRGAYRPGQTVRFAALLRKPGRDTRFTNVVGRNVTVTVVGPRGKKLHTVAAETDDYGMVQGEWTVPAEPTLGRYRVQIKSGRSVPTGSAFFRIEEYKRPEFEVTAVAEDPVRSGEVLTAKIDAKYYFGGPVAGAKVKYRIHRAQYWHRFRFSDSFAFLYDRPARLWGGPRRRSSRDELVLSGEGVTDADGSLRVKVPTAPWTEKYPGQDHRFRIEAEVMDLSRRTISGTGTVTVAATEYFAALRPTRGFAAPGETIRVELRTERADGAAVARSGVLKIVKTEAPDRPVRRGGVRSDKDDASDPAKETLVETLPAATDKNGRGFIDVKVPGDGYYVLRFEARDATEAMVRAETPLWICGPGWNGRSFRFEGLDVLTDRSDYKVGDVARLLINASAEKASVLLCEIANRSILAHRVVRLGGSSAVIELPVTKAMVPNIFVDATAIRDGQVLRARREVFVPPVDKFLNVDVQFAKADYEPGEEAEAIVRVTDADGNPHQGRVAFGTVDASLDVIQGDPTQDIRRAFYGERRSPRVRDQSSFQYRSFSATWAHVPVASHRFHGMPPEWYGIDRRQVLKSAGFGSWKGMPDHGGVEAEESADSAPAKRGFLNDAPAASAAASPAPESKRARRAEGRAGKKLRDFDVEAAPKEAPAPTALRQNFAETAHFAPAVDVGPDGTARVKFTLPDSLTRWRTTVRAYTPDTRVGQRKTAFITRKRILVRPQLPRFFRERDEVTVSAIVNSSLEATANVTVKIALDSPHVTLLDRAVRVVELPSGGEARVDWRVRVESAGATTIDVTAESTAGSDAVRRTVPVLRYGSERTVADTVAIRSDDGSADIAFTVPEARAAGSASLEIALSPSVAGVLLDALPYLIEYPHGCVEQTMSRFLPAVVARATLRQSGVDLEDLAKRAKKRGGKRAGLLAMTRSPVFDSDKLHDIATKGLTRIYGFQGADGGFGWFPGATSDPYMTAYVLYGLKRAQEAELPVNASVVSRALGFLERVTASHPNDGLHRVAYQCFALAVHGRTPPAKAFNRVFERRLELNHYTRAILALGAHHAGQAERARIVAENLEDYIKTDERTGACWLESTGYRWCWWSDSVETNAFALMAFNRVLPECKHRDGLVKWLVKNRRGRRWRSTKDTAHAILALAGYMRETGELDPDYEAEVLLDGEPIHTVRVTRANALTLDGRIRVADERLATGAHRLTIRKRGKGRLYASAQFAYFSRETEIAATEREFAVKRRYFRLTPKVETDKQGRAQAGFDREELAPGTRVKAGDEIEVEMTLDPHHAYDYVMIADPKPCGFEPVALRSGAVVRDGLWSYMELRDTRATFFVPRLPKAEFRLSYRLRAEAPGTLHAMPARGELMYAPEVGGESTSWRVVVTD